MYIYVIMYTTAREKQNIPNKHDRPAGQKEEGKHEV